MIKKIAFVITTLGGGGAERVISNLANELDGRGYDVSIIMLKTVKSAYVLSDNVKTISLECEKLKKCPSVLYPSVRHKRIRDCVKKLAPDVVIAFTSPVGIDTCFALWNRKIPVIVSERSDPRTEMKKKIRKLLRKIAYSRSQGFVFQTEEAKRCFSKKIQEKSCVILNPITGTLPERFSGVKDKRIVTVGRLIESKNFEMLIKAFAEFFKNHSDYSLEIYGEGKHRAALEKFISDSKLNECVRLMGFCDNVSERINSAAVFAFPSDYEGMPNALLEAMCMGMTCISTDCPCGGPRMLINNGENGILVKVNDGQAVTDALERVINDPKLAERLGNNAYKLREKADVKYVTDQWLKFIEERINK